MQLDVLIDSDVIEKLCLYSLKVWEEGELFARRRLATVNASRYILPKRLNRARVSAPRNQLMSALASFTQSATFVEPDERELAFAAAMEFSAQRNGFAFDSGESQLLAILIYRNARLLLTGDKRAIAAIAGLEAEHCEVSACVGRIGCFEQLIISLLKTLGGSTLRSRICAEPDADKALSISFRCATCEGADSVYLEGLESYLQNLRKRSAAMLCTDESLSRPAQEDGVGLS